ncbi:hypothetical protein [Paraburkholderia sp. DGU8]|uniref:hypothetical protein n=1 Tax=Paraburkholderia sp. DGU8 TaxID=3161997 RepID=UPI0034663276
MKQSIHGTYFDGHTMEKGAIIRAFKVDAARCRFLRNISAATVDREGRVRPF